MRWVWRGGRPEPGSPPDPRHAAWGVFTTAGCEGGRPLLWPAHARRLARDAAALDPATSIRPPAAEELQRLLRDARLSGPTRLRVAAWRGPEGWRLGAEALPLEAGGPDLPPLALAPVRWEAAPPLAGHKALARLPWEAAAGAARRAGADDALLVDAAGRVLETSVANLWVVAGKAAATPPAPARCLPGVMRAWLLERLDALGFEPTVRDLTLEEVLAADEVWVSNAVVGARRVARVGPRSWDRWPAFERLAALDVPAPGWPR